MKTFSILKTIVLLLISLPHCIAQTDSSRTPERPKVVVFEETGRSEHFSNSNKPAPLLEHKNALKFSPILVIVGDVPVHYERKMNNRLSLEAGVGFTTQNFAYELFRFMEYNDVLEREFLFGYSFSGALRYYANEVFDGFYFGPQYRVRNYSSEINRLNNQILIPSQKESRLLQDITIQMGMMQNITNNVFVDLYLGLGARLVEERLGVISHTYENNESRYRVNIEPSRRQTLALNAGFRIGLTF